MSFSGSRCARPGADVTSTPLHGVVASDRITLVRPYGGTTVEGKPLDEIKLWPYSQSGRAGGRSGPPAGEGVRGAIRERAQAGDAAADHRGGRSPVQGR